MRLLILIFASLIAAPALAYDLRNLSPQDVLLLGEALDAMPHGKVASLYNRIQQQLSAEDAAAQAETRIRAEKEIRDKISSESRPPPPPPPPSTPLPPPKDKPDE